ncbi:30S ribosomal protein S4 [Candidatus Woesearchaeota archaeon]|nr:30S ribosomal protein S4 [Candidatus Woesearchaeota archaeon]
MGDPRKQRKKYSTPMHPWQKERLDEESEIRKKYGTRNKKEIWRMDSKLKTFFVGAKKANSARTDQEKIEAEQLLTKLRRLGLISETDGPDTILSLTLPDLMERRLQTLVLKKGLAKTIKQARQYITHEHILIGDKKMTSPSYLVTLDEENMIAFDAKSPFKDPMHPEREKLIEKEKEEMRKSLKKEKSAEQKEETAESKAEPVEKEEAAEETAAPATG